MKKIILACMLATSTVACSPMPDIRSAGEYVVVKGTQALIAAEYAYNSVGQIVLVGLRSGTITGANATRVRELNQIATDALIRGKAAITETARAVAAAEVITAVTGIRQIIGR